jgi:type IV fimbrial biogenesis protein FimT
VLEPLNPAMPTRTCPPTRAHAGRRRGFTLVELMIGLAVLAVLATLALPSMGSALQRHRLRAAAEHLAADLTEARFEATRRGQTLHVLPRSGPDWCWAVAREPGCSCDGTSSDEAAPCQLSRSSQADHAGVQLLQAQAVELSPSGAAGAATTVQAALFEGRSGSRLQVLVTALGRTRVCAPADPVPGVPRC